MASPLLQNYRLELRPLDYYFFGGETTFGDGEGQNYYARTRPWPQQTSLLGVLRHLLYPNHCGPSSFRLDNATPYGSIVELSPLFFSCRKNGDVTDYFLSPWGNDSGKPYPLRADPGIKNANAQFTAGNIDDKTTPNQYLIDREGRHLAIQPPENGGPSLCSFFDKIGITKTTDGSDQTDAFYKQRMGRLAEGFSFASIVTLAEHLPDNLLNEGVDGRHVVTFGAERALFELRLRKTDQSFEQLFPDELLAHDYASAGNCYLLTSDTYLEDETLLEELEFVITGTRSFRYINTPQNEAGVNFAKLARTKEARKNALSKSDKYYLLQAGSLLYGNAETIEKAFAHSAFRQIGYNHFVKLQNTST